MADKFLDKQSEEHGFTVRQCGIVPFRAYGYNTEVIQIAYDFRFKGDMDVIEAHKLLIKELAENIRVMQKANRTPSAIWTQQRTNDDQLECSDVCPFGYDKILDSSSPNGIGVHYHDIEQYHLEEV